MPGCLAINRAPISPLLSFPSLSSHISELLALPVFLTPSPSLVTSGMAIDDDDVDASPPVGRCLSLLDI